MALGIGIAASTGMGLGVARADDATKSPGSPSSVDKTSDDTGTTSLDAQRDSEPAKTDPTDEDPVASASSTKADAEGDNAPTDIDPADGETESSERRSNDPQDISSPEVDAGLAETGRSSQENSRTHDRPSSRPTVTPNTDDTAKTDAGPDTEADDLRRRPPATTATPTAPLTTLMRATSTVSEPTPSASAPRPVPTAVSIATSLIAEVVSSLLAPDDGAPAKSAPLLALLAWSRREYARSMTSETAAPQTFSALSLDEPAPAAMSMSATERLDDLLNRTGTPVTGPVILASDKLTMAINEHGAVIVGGVSGTGLIFDNVEFVKWGSPVWNFAVAYDGDNYYAAEGYNGGFSSSTSEDLSSGTFHGYKMTATVGTDVRIERVIAFYDGDEYAVVATRLTNIGDSPLTNVAILENTDPDQGIPLTGDYATYNDVVLDGDFVRSHITDGTYPDGLTIGFGSADPRAVASGQADGISNTDPFLIIGNAVDPDGVYDDIGINLATMFGTLLAGDSVTGGLIVALGTSTSDAEATYLAAAPITLTGTTVDGNPVVAVDDALTGNEDIAVTGNLLTNDIAANPDGPAEPLAVITTGTFSTTAGGSVTIGANGDFTYTAAANFNGTDSFTYLISDTTTYDMGYVAITLAAVEDDIIAYGSVHYIDEDTQFVDNLLQYEYAGNPDGPDEPLTTTPGTFVTTGGGSVAIAADGSFTYSPKANFNGSDTFTYTVSDGTSTAVGTVVLNLYPINDAPVAVNDSKVLTEDTPRTFTAADLLWNDTDPDKTSGDVLSFHSVSGASNGTVVLNANGTITFTPTTNYSGPASFTYRVKDTADAISANTATVSLTINPVNDAPVAVNDSKVLTEDTPRTFTAADLLWNDTDPDKTSGDVLSFHSVSGAINGTVVLNANGTITFTPTTNYSGPASFTYRVKDTADAISANTATVSLTINPVNDAPVAVNDTKTVNANTSYTFTAAELVGNDTDPDSGDVLSVHSVTAASNGTVVLNANGTVTFTPATNYSGPASFTYRVKDTAGAISATAATVALTVRPPNSAPTAVNDSKVLTEDTPRTFTAADLLWNDTDPDKTSGDVLSFHSVSGASNGTVVLNANGTITFTPTTNYSGPASFTYRVKDTADAISANTATVSLTINPVNDAPVAVNDSKVLTEDTPRTFTAADLLWNDTDPDKTSGDVLSFHSVSGAINGTVVLNANGTITFTPTTNYSGPASFTYRVKDTADAISANTATVSLTINPVNDAPVAVNDTKTVNANTSYTFTAAELVGNDTDPDSGDVLSVHSVTAASNGTVVLNANGTVTFTPATNYSGPASFTYRVKDTAGAISATAATVALTVRPPNSAPTAVNDSKVLTEDTPRTFTAADLLWNDTDPDKTYGDVLRFHSVDNVAWGTAVLNSDGTVTFTPNANYYGGASFTYQVMDAAGLVSANAATVNLTINNVNDAPTAVADSYATDEGAQLTISGSNWLEPGVLGNDINPDPDLLTAGVVTNPSHGVLALNPDGGFTYTPNAGYRGPDAFTYRAFDGTFYSDSATVTLIVRPVITATDSITLGTSKAPVDIVITPDGTRAYVLSKGAHSLDVIDIDPASPTYHTSSQVLELYSGYLDPNKLAISPDGKRLVITTNYFEYDYNPITDVYTPNFRILIVDVDPSSVNYHSVRTMAIGDHTPQGVAFSMDSNRVYITRSNGHVSVIDVVGTPTLVASIPTSGTDYGSIAVNPDGLRAYATNYYAEGLSIIDIDQSSATYNTVIWTIPGVSGTKGIQISPTGKVAYAATESQVLAIDLDPNSATFNTVIGSTLVYNPYYPAYGPRNVTFSPDGSLVYITVLGTNLAFDADPSSPTFNKIVAEYSGGDGQLAVTPDGTRAYATVYMGSQIGTAPAYTGSVTALSLGSGTYGASALT